MSDHDRSQNIYSSHFFAAAAVKSNAIVSSLFPSSVRDRLFNEAVAEKSETDGGGLLQPTKTRLKNFLDDGSRLELKDLHDDPEHFRLPRSSSVHRPIADLFPHTTVLFADIAGL